MLTPRVALCLVGVAAALAACDLLGVSPDVALRVEQVSRLTIDTAPDIEVAYVLVNAGDEPVRWGWCCGGALVLEPESVWGDSLLGCRPSGPCVAFCPIPAFEIPAHSETQGTRRFYEVQPGEYRFGIGYTRVASREWCVAWSAPLAVPEAPTAPPRGAPPSDYAPGRR